MNLFAVCLEDTVALAENFSFPQPFATLPKPFSPTWATWIQSHEGSHVLGHVLFPAGLHFSDYQIEPERMLAQIIHRKPLVNGYSEYFPPGYDRFQLNMAKHFPPSLWICFLGNELKEDTQIIDLPLYEDHQDQMEQFKKLSLVAYRDKDALITEIPGMGGNCRQEEK